MLDKNEAILLKLLKTTKNDDARPALFTHSRKQHGPVSASDGLFVYHAVLVVEWRVTECARRVREMYAAYDRLNSVCVEDTLAVTVKATIECMPH